MDVQERTLAEKIEALPPRLQREVEDFVDFLHERHAPTSPGRTLDQSWAGALSHLKDQYTSVELQHEILNLWEKAARD